MFPCGAWALVRRSSGATKSAPITSVVCASMISSARACAIASRPRVATATYRPVLTIIRESSEALMVSSLRSLLLVRSSGRQAQPFPPLLDAGSPPIRIQVFGVQVAPQ